jgi:EAL domain-containing protein (putative c-di-GMP-specific phosphodiesterase class I)
MPTMGFVDIQRCAGSAEDFNRFLDHSLVQHLKHRPRAAESLWLFLNLRINSPLLELKQALCEHEQEAHSLVLEIIEDPGMSDAWLDELRACKAKGALLAVDDFGAGHSNFDRLWELEPDIVKLDRSIVVSAVERDKMRRLLNNMTELIHQMGALVLVEGIETRDELMLTLDSGADLAQGFLFARPQPPGAGSLQTEIALDELWDRYARDKIKAESAIDRMVAEAINALGFSASLMQENVPLEAAARHFLSLDSATRLYLLDAHGKQLGENQVSSEAENLRFAPLVNAAGANWSRRSYFRSAIAHPGRVHVKGPYLSVTGDGQCFTLAVSLASPQGKRVLCGDLSIPQV